MKEEVCKECFYDHAEWCPCVECQVWNNDYRFKNYFWRGSHAKEKAKIPGTNPGVGPLGRTPKR